jgi:hypothetical protein
MADQDDREPIGSVAKRYVNQNGKQVWGGQTAAL